MTFVSGDRARWREQYEEFLTWVCEFGPGVAVAPTDSYISIVRKGKKCAIVRITAGRLDIGIGAREEAPGTD